MINNQNKIKGTLKVKKKDIKLELDNLTIDQYRFIAELPAINIGGVVEKHPVGKLITLITSNMPFELKKAIDDMIKKYCNH